MKTIIFKHLEAMTLNVKNDKRDGSESLTEKVALNAYESDGSKLL